MKNMLALNVKIWKIFFLFKNNLVFKYKIIYEFIKKLQCLAERKCS